MFKIITTKDKSKCCAYRCKNERAVRDRFCHRHRKMYFKINNPQKYTYNVLKNNAKRRGKSFELTFAEFQKLCEETGYMDSKGRTANAATLDRKDPNKGYTYDNIRVISNSLNVAKGNMERHGYECPF